MDGEVYRCTGWLTEHLRCSFKTQTPERQVWRLTACAKQLGKLGKMPSKAPKMDRFVPSEVGRRLFSRVVSEDAEEATVSIQAKPPLLNLSVYLAKGFEESKREELTELVQGHRGQVVETISRLGRGG